MNELNMASKHTSNYSSRDYFTLEFIPFVTPVQELESVSDTHEPQHISVPHKSFSGKEASEFYKNIIAIPSTPTPRISRPVVNPTKADRSVKPNTYTPNNLLKYAQDGNLKAIEECVNKNDLSLLNMQDMYGWTPLMCAACEGHVPIVKYLMQCGANLSVVNKQGMTAMDIAVTKHQFDIVEVLKYGWRPIKEEVIDEMVEPKGTYCDACKLVYKESKAFHERSIAHLFSVKKSDSTTFYHIPENNKGFQMMLRSGWDQNKGLGPKAEGRKFPVKTILKKDRSCIGRGKEIARVTHFNANDKASIKKICDPAVKIVRERTMKKWQRAKLEKKNRQKEIEFRQQFICDF